MRIKRLEITGFKSFSEKTLLDFQQPITGIVGPNGCGKSNIVDAIRWCLGEQSAKNLRGKGMEDVIFAGSETRKPLGVAEVSLVFSTEDGRAPTKYLGFNEIQLTRRLYRDGESEYLINKTPCRLLDIAELFMDTGVGTKAYSIIEQGKIGQILHARPEERRVLIEEAAGVTKFKNRKIVALRKIEATRQNIHRLQDIISELKRQANYLQRQAKKAERFKLARDEARTIDLQFLRWDANKIITAHTAADGQLVEIESQLSCLQHTVTTAEAALEQDRLALAEQEHLIAQAQENLFTARNELMTTENQLLLCEQEHKGLTLRLERHRSDCTTITEQTAVASLRIEETANQRLSMDLELQSTEAALDALRRQEEEKDLKYEVDNQRVDTLRQQQIKCEAELVALQARIEQGLRQTETLEKQLAQQQQELVQYQSRETTQRTVLSTLENELKSMTSALQNKQELRAALESRAAALAEQEPILAQRAQRALEQRSKTASRLQSLEELERHFSGYSAGTRHIKTAYPARETLGTVLADTITIEEHYERALEVVIADKLQAIQCNTVQEAFSAIRHLHDNQAGRAHFIIPQSHHITPVVINGATNLADVTEVTGPLRSVVQGWLANVHVVHDLSDALTMHTHYPEATFVTLEGDIVYPDGSLIGGTPESRQGSMIQTKREIRTLKDRLVIEGQELSQTEQELSDTRDQLSILTRQIQEHTNHLHQLEIERTRKQKDQERESEELQRLLERLTATQSRILETSAQNQTSQADRTLVAAERESANQRLTELTNLLAAEEATMEQRRAERTTEREQYTNQRITAATRREHFEALQRLHTELTEQQEQRLARQLTLTQDLHHLTEQLAETEKNSESIKHAISSCVQKVTATEAVLSALREQHDRCAQAVQTRDHSVKTLRGQREALQQQQAETSMSRTELSLQLEHINTLAFERHRIDLATWDAPPLERDIHEETLSNRQKTLTATIEELGEVNLLAIEEFAEVEQRQLFLEGQRTDLETSLHDLQQAIQKINRTTRKRFLETFTIVNKTFQEVFPRLFCGGHAELRLTDEQDLLETGIDIIVQPPGKKLANVMLLSGGEKALTAVALIFSLFLIKPTPFCLLDEVDAPLDDANIGRFNEMVREMSNQSQFILITHNKTTMAVADTLYGVTMEEPGSSRLVSVNLN